MRLKDEEKQVILQTIHSIDPNAKIYLFGSRVNDSDKGGDIDLLVFSRKISYGDKLTVKKNIFSVLEEQKIDLIVTKDGSEPFVRMVLEQGVQLL
ncbi:MAG TPA: nucleotidyltransferase domain-containing protein [Desulfobacteraceae bacterium]|nr:nucleotidyltransferase domain-containing protein [Deltaproteobacteria bacterium]RLB21598.1 MAG: nucleotidyltransferase domain-containing protein [Deltaproteobacteria bacterium]HDH87033.1 nucleotidyltransferase domain-containing protein [Desulfobacteraceae bacterium]